jgi:hypothetical protein
MTEIAHKLSIESEKMDYLRQRDRTNGQLAPPQLTEPSIVTGDIQPDLKGKGKVSWIPAQSSRHFVAGGLVKRVIAVKKG